MKLILTTAVDKLGIAGDVVDVRPGYGRNYLLPQGHAIRWTLEIRAAKPVRVYPGMTFGKLVFLTASGTSASYQQQPAKYAATDGIGISRLYEEIREGIL